MEEEQCPCDDCGANCDYWDSKYCCIYCRWQYGDIEPDCKNCPLYKVCRNQLTSCEIYCEKYSYIQSDEMWRIIP